MATVRASLQLLDSRSRRLLILVIAAQMATSFMDLAAITLVGVVSAMGVGLATGKVSLEHTQLPGFLASETPSLQVLGSLGAIAAVLLVSKSFISMLLTRSAFRFLARRQAEASGWMMRSLLEQPLLFTKERSTQETAYALNSGTTQAILVVLGQLVIVCTEVSLLAVLVVGLFIFDPSVTLYSLIFFILVGAALHVSLARRASRLGRSTAEFEVNSNALVQDTLRSYREIAVAGRRNVFASNFARMRSEAAELAAESQFLGQISKYVFEIALVVGGVLLTISQTLSSSLSAAVATVAVFLVAGSRIMPALLRLQSATLSIRTSAGQAQPTYDLATRLRSSSRKVTTSTRQPVDHTVHSLRTSQPTQLSVQVANASFTYPGALSPALHGIDLYIKGGTSAAFVGSSGAGKSTLADLILGLIAPDEGSALVDGVTCMEISESFPGLISYVPQEPAMIRGTVRENIVLGTPNHEVDEDQLWRVLETVHLADYLSTDREGLNTIIGEAGTQLSGGQRQRLGLARALYTNPRVLVLDEATSALDATTESQIIEILDSLRGEITLVAIAHRLSTIRNFDQIFFLRAGKIAGVGTFDELRASELDFERLARHSGL